VSYLTTPPWIWLLLGGAGSVALIRPRSRQTIAGLALLVPLLLLSATDSVDKQGLGTYWSPYQRLTLSRRVKTLPDQRELSYLSIAVNSVHLRSLPRHGRALPRRV
jgi:hypothetical protein